MTSIDRHGMNKSDNDPIPRASFEKMVEQFITASVFGETDTMKGVSSRVAAGLVVKGGTGMCDVVLDTKMLERSEFVEGGDEYGKVFKEIQSSSVITDIVGKEDIGDVFIPE